MRSNLKSKPTHFTHEGGPAISVSPIKELRRSLMACMLWENGFYESGEDQAARMARLISQCSFADAAQAAVDAREKFKLRHAPLFVVRELLRKHTGRQVGDLIERVIQRPDEMGELLALYWKDDANRPLTAQLKVGLARAFKKFDEYQLAKYNRDAAVKLRDVLFLAHPKPRDEAHAALFKRVAEDELVTPGTWENELSAGKDKGETFTRLISEKKLGALALLRNLRGMLEAGVSEDVIRDGLNSMKVERVLPFRFITAARYAPRLEDALEAAMFRCLTEVPKLGGKTAILIDHSGSMNERVSSKSEVTRFDAAVGVAMILREVAERVRVFAFSTTTVEVPPRRGFALAQATRESMPFGGTSLGQAVSFVYAQMPECERLIVVTDEQSADRPQHPQGRGYIVNVAGYQNGIAYGPWISIDGWSEAVVDYVREFEAES